MKLTIFLDLPLLATFPREAIISAKTVRSYIPLEEKIRRLMVMHRPKKTPRFLRVPCPTCKAKAGKWCKPRGNSRYICDERFRMMYRIAA